MKGDHRRSDDFPHVGAGNDVGSIGSRPSIALLESGRRATEHQRRHGLDLDSKGATGDDGSSLTRKKRPV